MTPNLRLLALDLDGTTLNAKKTISDENRVWIRKAKEAGIEVILATGRDYHQVLPFQKQLGFDSPMVLANGSEVRDSSGEILEQHLLDQVLLKKAWDLAQEENVMFGGYTTKGWEIPSPASYEWLNLNWLKAGFRSDDREFLNKIPALLTTWEDVEVTYSQWNIVEINPKGVSKATGVRRVCRLLGIEMSQVMAIGDSLNDYTLFKEAGWSVAMANADDPLKKIANQLTLSNEADGVAKAIQKVFFDKEE